MPHSNPPPVVPHGVKRRAAHLPALATIRLPCESRRAALARHAHRREPQGGTRLHSSGINYLINRIVLDSGRYLFLLIREQGRQGIIARYGAASMPH